MDRTPIIARILQMLARTEPEEMGCSEVYELLDEFTERQARGEDVSEYLPLVKHLRMCGDCREEYEALLSIVSMRVRAPATTARSTREDQARG